MSALDTLADKAQAASQRLAAQGGIKAKLADELADDAAFLRKLKPALIKKRAKGELPTDQKAGDAPAAPSGPQLGGRPEPEPKPKSGAAGPSPFVIIGVALVLGVAAAKLIDWRGHAHPRW
jgi:hypothetical protein